MALVVVFLVLSGSIFLKSSDVLSDDNYGSIKLWEEGNNIVKRQGNGPAGGKNPEANENDTVNTLLRKFPKYDKIGCEMLHKTNDAPFTAIVLYKTSGRLLCMGSIVDSRHVLSAKKCYHRSEARDLLILVGCHKAYWGKYSQVVHVNKIIRHDLEIALLRLASPLTFTPYVQATRLPPMSIKRDTTDVFSAPFSAIGFYVDRFDIPGDPIGKDKSYKIKEDSMVEFDECQKNYSRLHLDNYTMFCIIGNASYCWGGWGGPVVKSIQSSISSYYVQVGVVIADNCTTSTTGPLLVARTDVFADWIRGNVFHGRQPQ